jgi:hypothetical protein
MFSDMPGAFRVKDTPDGMRTSLGACDRLPDVGESADFYLGSNSVGHSAPFSSVPIK